MWFLFGEVLFLWVPGMGYVILLWHSLSLPYTSNYFGYNGNFDYDASNKPEKCRKLMSIVSLYFMTGYRPSYSDGTNRGPMHSSVGHWTM